MKKLLFKGILLASILFLTNHVIKASSITIHGPTYIEYNREYDYNATSQGVITWQNSRFNWSFFMTTSYIHGEHGDRWQYVKVKVDDASRIGGMLTLRAYLDNTGVFGTGTVWGEKEVYVVLPSSQMPNITSNYNPSTALCSTFSEYTFTIEKARENLYYTWTLPSGWVLTRSEQTTQSAGKFYSTIKAKPSILINGSYPTGNVTVSLNQSGGYVASKSFPITVSNVVSVSNIPSELRLCANTPQNLTPLVSGGIAPLTYAWKLDNATVSTSLSYPVKITGTRSDATYTFSVTDARGCAFNTNVKLINNSNFSWMTGTPYMNVAPKPALAKLEDAYPISDLAIAPGGAPYYIGDDKKIWAYKWNNAFGRWENPTFAMTQLATGKLIFPEGSYNAYFTAEPNNEVYMLNVNLAGAQPVAMGISGVTNFVSDWYGNIYAASSNEIWRINSSGNVTSIKSGLSNIMRIATSQHIIYVAYYNGTIESFPVSTPSVITPISTVNPIATLDNGWPAYFSSLEADWYGNVFFVDSKGQVEVIKTGMSSAQITLTLAGSQMAFGNLHVNRSTGNVYYNARNGYIYQLAKNGNSYLWKTFGYFGTYWAEYGDMAFAHPNLFYIDGLTFNVRFAYYSTLSGNCAPSIIRADEETTTTESPVSYSSYNTLQLNVAPNPASGPASILINSQEEISDVMIAVYDLEGKKVADWGTGVVLIKGENELPVNTSELSGGLYLVRVSSATQTLGTTKLIIQ